jgi:hypothetical protein
MWRPARIARQRKVTAMSEEAKEKQHTFTEQIEIAGNELVDWVKQLLAEGNVRQLRIKAA